ncbi:hypothetical protein LHK94_20405 [Dickeya zeae]|uniref:hypothetical protein n=1 Tax=Dickeya zeae TaxID=204042 RepID=UPI001CFC151C|nr:hypothetical protein [Dickeya zeae]UCZ75318.1 hypothetical protein LHK94_20405 [Dickeya zeae]
MADVRGLADGFLSGFNTAENALQRREDSELRRLQMQQQQQNADRNFGLAQSQFDYRKDADNQDRQRQKERDKVGDDRWQSEFEQSKRNADRSFGLQAAGLDLRREEFAYQRAEKERQRRMTEQMPTVQAFYDRLKTNNGQWDEGALRLAGQISDDNPYSPKRFIGPDKIQTVRDMNKIMPQVMNGQVDYNDPTVVSVADKVLAPYIKRGLGEKDPSTGKTIKDKELAHIGMTEDGKGLLLSLKTKYDDGSVSSMKPMTRYASSDPQDNVVVIPLDKAMEQFRGYGQMVGAMNSDPSTAQFMNRLVNGSSKQDRAEAKEYRTQVINSQKERAKALAKDPDNASTINTQFDRLDDQIAESFGQKPKNRTAPVLQQWAGNDPGKAAFAQKALSAGAFSGDVTPAQLEAKYAEYQKGASVTSNAQNNQPKNNDSYTAQYLREMQKVSQRK